MTDRQTPDQAQHTAPEAMPPEPATGGEPTGSVGMRGAGGGAGASVTGDDARGDEVGGTDSYPADGAAPDRGGAAPKDD